MISHLFLDIDGVCNNTMTQTWFDPFNMGNLKNLWELLGRPKIVLSSDWRRTPKNLEEARSNLAAIGLEIFACTPCHTSVLERADEITEWLTINEHNNCVILDDMSADFVDPELPNVFFFRTDHQFGLTEDDVDFIVRYIKDLK